MHRQYLHKYRERIESLIALGGILGLLLFFFNTGELREFENRSSRESPSLILLDGRRNASLISQAIRMQRRLLREQGSAPTVAALLQALEERLPLLNRNVTLSLTFDNGREPIEHTLSIRTFPTILSLVIEGTSARFAWDASSIREALATIIGAEVSPPEHAIVTGTSSDGKNVLRASVSRIPKGGYTFDIEKVAAQVLEALEEPIESTIEVPIAWEEGHILYTSELGEVKELNLLSSGYSNFKGSPKARVANILKALNEHLNGILVTPGATFSFNNSLGGPVTQSRGWREALGIFDGEELRPTPGGGVCQTSTTLYRALVYAGLPITERRHHSIYVRYYEEGDVGLDATIFLGTQDLKFTNDTSDYILFQAFAKGDDAFINLYGVPDGRTVELEGPYLTSNMPKGFRVKNRPLGSDEIAWIQRIRWPNGTTEVHELISRYRHGFPSRLHAKFTEVEKVQHAAAPPTREHVRLPLGDTAMRDIAGSSATSL